MIIKLKNLFTIKYLSAIATFILIISILSICLQGFYLFKTNKFNTEIAKGENPSFFEQSFEARYATAYWLAKKEMFKESTILFNNLMKNANLDQKSAIQYNIGNIFFKRGLLINGTSMTVRDEAEYLFQQAAKAYKQSLKFKPYYWDAKHNLDRLLTMLPPDPTPGVGDSDSPGLIMGNIPVGLP
jgi:mxaK protein